MILQIYVFRRAKKIEKRLFQCLLELLVYQIGILQGPHFTCIFIFNMGKCKDNIAASIDLDIKHE